MDRYASLSDGGESACVAGGYHHTRNNSISDQCPPIPRSLFLGSTRLCKETINVLSQPRQIQGYVEPPTCTEDKS